MIQNTPRSEKIIDKICKEIHFREVDKFANFVKIIIGNKDSTIVNLTQPLDILSRLVEILSAKKVPTGVSLNSLFKIYNDWHAKDLKLMHLDLNVKSNESNDECKNVTASETGGMVLAEIGKELYHSKTVTPTAVNQLIDKLISKNQEDSKLKILQHMLKNSLKDNDNNDIKEYFQKIEKIVYKAADIFVDFIEQARFLDQDQEVVTVDNIIKILQENDLYDNHFPFDIEREKMLLELFADWANNVELANDDDWKELVIEALVEDYQMGPINPQQYEHLTPLDVPREETNIMKSFQTIVANIFSPPPQRGRPRKQKK